MPAPLTHTHSSSSPIPWWIRIAVAIGALLFLAGGVISLIHPQLLVSPHDEISSAVRIYAGYVASRDLALALLLLGLLFTGAKRALSQLLALVSLIQLFDAIIDITESRWPILPGILILGLLYLLVAIRLNQNPPWYSRFWKP